VSPRVNEGGFTVIEVIVAVLVLTIGVTALVGSSALVTRQVGRGRIVTIANQRAAQ
jgi:prepilin-type N-terminal cleavage/methylation domain-containing protein